ncbi:hypothetical protein AIH60_10560 [Salmonella enterica subsp. enterica]|nr:hypothetical protein [Salmonella enterica subsp. enterica]ECH9344905.1 hypothetical protein [Salmonella enterica subsp. enterica]ECT9471055.1 hypothetical protein [Salmonella enterica subsp. enterica serovar Carrau]MIE50538.1 hypothetical protein [Salmonella enterica subsp. enterica]
MQINIKQLIVFDDQLNVSLVLTSSPSFRVGRVSTNMLEHYHLDQVKYKITQRSSLLLRGTLRKQDNKPDNKSMYLFLYPLKTVGYF